MVKFGSWFMSSTDDTILAFITTIWEIVLTAKTFNSFFMSIVSIIGLVLVVVGLVVLAYEELELNYKNPKRVKYAVYGVIIGAVLMGIGAAIWHRISVLSLTSVGVFLLLAHLDPGR